MTKEEELLRNSLIFLKVLNNDFFIDEFWLKSQSKRFLIETINEIEELLDEKYTLSKVHREGK